MPSYALRCWMEGHGSDVRALATSDKCIISGSRDKTMAFWVEKGLDYERSLAVREHSNFVSSVCILPPSARFPEGLVAAGGQDGSILCFKLYSEKPVATLLGHASNVCCLAASAKSPTHLFSASWDGTAKLWDAETSRCLNTYVGHESAVWCVLHVPDDFVVTGAADNLVMVHSYDGGHRATLTGHTDCVRAFAYDEKGIFYSCSNDGTVRKWNVRSETCIAVVYSHDSFIYGLARSGDLMAFCGEDGILIIIDEKEGSTQLVQHPAISVWAVTILPNSDVVTGSSDAVIRIFSRDQSRMASSQARKDFEKEVKNFTKKICESSNQCRAYGPPRMSGKFDGELTYVKDKGTTICYRWNQSNGLWEEASWKRQSGEDLVPEAASSHYYPPEKYVLFEHHESDLILEKLKEFMVQMRFPEMEAEDALASFKWLLTSPDGRPADFHVKVLIAAVREWPETFVFPVLDVLRIAVLKRAVHQVLFGPDNCSKLFSSLSRFMKPEALVVNRMFLFRILSNMFAWEKGQSLLFSRKDYLFEVAPDIVGDRHGRLEVAYATFLLNMSLAALGRKDLATGRQCVAAVRRTIAMVADHEAVFRLLVAVGTISLLEVEGILADDLLQAIRDVSSWPKTDRVATKAATCAGQILYDLPPVSL